MKRVLFICLLSFLGLIKGQNSLKIEKQNNLIFYVPVYNDSISYSENIELILGEFALIQPKMKYEVDISGIPVKMNEVELFNYYVNTYLKNAIQNISSMFDFLGVVYDVTENGIHLSGGNYLNDYRNIRNQIFAFYIKDAYKRFEFHQKY